MNYIRGNQIKDGGEGKILEVQGRSDILMKIYKEKNAQGKPIFTPALQLKLKYMIDNPPTSLINQGVIAWPLDFVIEQGKVAGFIMPRLIFNASIQSISAYKHPVIDKKNYNDLPAVKSRIGIAINLASTLSELHRVGCIVGDLNHDNIGINKSNAQINVVDCDSFHTIDRNGNTMRTNVVMEGYLAPEIIAHCNNERSQGRLYEIDNVALPTFSKYSDLFCLAVHIFKLLMNGVHPFLGVKENATGSNATPFVGHEGVERNNYVLKSGLRPSAVYCLASNEIPQEIVSMFNRTFVDGHIDPSKRSTAEEWYKILSDFMSKLKQCSNNQKHQYYNILSYCPYCEADKRHLAVQQGNTPIYRPPIPQPPSAPPVKKKPSIAALIAIAAVVVIVIIGFSVKNANTSNNKTPVVSKQVQAQQAIQKIMITSIKTGNSTKDNNWIDQPGSTLYAKNIRYLSPVITYHSSFSGDVTFYIRLIQPDGVIKRNPSTSPEGYTYLKNISITRGENKSLELGGWGNDNSSSYQSGEWTIEVWYDGVRLRSEKIRLN